MPRCLARTADGFSDLALAFFYGVCRQADNGEPSGSERYLNLDEGRVGVYSQYDAGLNANWHTKILTKRNGRERDVLTPMFGMVVSDSSLEYR